MQYKNKELEEKQMMCVIVIQAENLYRNILSERRMSPEKLYKARAVPWVGPVLRFPIICYLSS